MENFLIALAGAALVAALVYGYLFRGYLKEAYYDAATDWKLWDGFRND